MVRLAPGIAWRHWQMQALVRVHRKREDQPPARGPQVAMRLDGKTGLAIKAVCALLLLLVAAVCPAANTDGVGLNTQLIQEYYWYLNGNCTAYQSQLNAGAGCPSNAMGHSLDQISRIIQDLVVNQHVTTFREVVPLALMSPAGTNDPTGAAMATDATNYALMDAILGLFKTHGVHLILALGDPVPNWAVPWAVPYGNRYGCFLPSSATDFQTFKNNLSWTVGNYLQHLSQLSRPSRPGCRAEDTGPCGSKGSMSGMPSVATRRAVAHPKARPHRRRSSSRESTGSPTRISAWES